MLTLQAAACITSGFVGAYLLEPVWHRWLAHGRRDDPSRRGHLEHHRRASELVDVWGELREHGVRVAVVLVALGGGLALAMGAARGVGLTAGLAAGFLAVNFSHARMHARAPRGRFEEWMWRFHWYHHAVDARVNFGLTHPLLDFALKTAVVPPAVELHPRLAPRWLREAGGARAGISIAAERGATNV